MTAARSWEEVNEGLIYKNVWSLAQSPASDRIYAGTEPANLFVSDDGGDTWQHLPAIRDLPGTKDWFFPKPPHVAHVRGITISPIDPDEVYCAIEDGWIIRSRDGGQTWAELRDGVDVDAHRITYLPPDHQTVFLSSGHFGFRSTDGGDTFQPSHEGIEGGYMTDIVVHPDRPEVLLTAAARQPGELVRTGRRWPGRRVPQPRRRSGLGASDQGPAGPRAGGHLGHRRGSGRPGQRLHRAVRRPHLGHRRRR